MATDYGSNIGRSKGRPIGDDGRGTMINPARRTGGGGFRDAMRGMDVPLRDRVKARNLDARIARQDEAATAPVPSGPTPATGVNLNSRQNLFAQMEKSGPAGISQQMRQQARSLGVTDQQFNDAAGRIGTNATYSPFAAPAPAEVPAYRTPPVTAAAKASTVPMQGNEVSLGNPRVNKETGRVFGNSGYKPLWRRGGSAPARI